jgi:hypothetical protein
VTIADEKAAKGAALLDKRLPGWRDKVEPETLQLRWCSSCVLGQLFGAYDRGIELLGLNDQEAREYGFYAGGATRPTTWERLTIAWRKLLWSP